MRSRPCVSFQHLMRQLVLKFVMFASCLKEIEYLLHIQSDNSNSFILYVHSQIQDFVVEHVVRTECVFPASLQSTYKPSTSVGTLPQNSKFPTTWWPLCGRNLIEIYHIVNFKVTPEWHWSRLLGTLCGSDLCSSYLPGTL